jgi:hypothetical protein
VQVEKLTALIGLLVGNPDLRGYRYSALLCNNTDGFRKSYSFSQHYKLKDIAAHLAAMTKEKLFVSMDRK